MVFLLPESLVTIVIPVFNEESNVALLCRTIHRALNGWGRSYEVLFVDDHSCDGTVDAIRLEVLRDKRLRLVQLDAHVGQTGAFSAGFKCARGDVIVTMDGDLQNDPSDIPRLVSLLQEGSDIVCGWRKNRQDSWLSRRLVSSVANWIIARMTGVNIHDTGCSLRCYRGELIRAVPLYADMHRFLPALCSIAGARLIETPVKHHARTRGLSKYGLSRVFRVVPDCLAVALMARWGHRPALGFYAVAEALGCLAATALVVLSAERLLGNDVGTDWLFRGTIILCGSAIYAGAVGLLADSLTLKFGVAANRRLSQTLIEPHTPFAGKDTGEDVQAYAVSLVFIDREGTSSFKLLQESFSKKLNTMGIVGELCYFFVGPESDVIPYGYGSSQRGGCSARSYRVPSKCSDGAILSYVVATTRNRYVVWLPRMPDALTSLPEVLAKLDGLKDVVVARDCDRGDGVPRLSRQARTKDPGSRHGTSQGDAIVGFTREAGQQLEHYFEYPTLLPVIAAKKGFRVKCICACRHGPHSGTDRCSAGGRVRRLWALVGLGLWESPLRVLMGLAALVALVGCLLVTLCNATGSAVGIGAGYMETAMIAQFCFALVSLGLLAEVLGCQSRLGNTVLTREEPQSHEDGRNSKGPAKPAAVQVLRRERMAQPKPLRNT